MFTKIIFYLLINICLFNHLNVILKPQVEYSNVNIIIILKIFNLLKYINGLLYIQYSL